MPLPPALELVTRELPRAVLLDPPAFLARIRDRGLRRDLQEQAIHTIEKYSYPEPRAATETAAFAFYGTAGMNPTTHTGTCNSLNCRVANATAFARVAALYADFVTLPDTITN